MQGSELFVVPVDARADWHAFINLAWHVNRRDPHWVPPLRQSVRELLDQKRHPFWESYAGQFFIVRRNDRTVGRVAAIWPRNHAASSTGYFGFLEFEDDLTVVQALLRTAADTLRAQGFGEMLGPVNPSTNYELGVLVDGFNAPPFLMLTHNPPYYDRLLREAGLEKARDFYAYYVTAEAFAPSEKQLRVNRRLRERARVTLRNVDLKAFDREIALIGDLYNDAWADHWGFQPMTPAEFVQMGRDLRAIVDPELFYFIEYDGEAAGFLMALPNYNEVFARLRDGRLWPFGIFKFLWYRRRIGTARVITLGIRRQYQHLGLAGLVYPEIGARLIGKGYRAAEISWVVEGNEPMHSAARQLGAEVYKRYRVYSGPTARTLQNSAPTDA
jgi:hypothetical protein